VRYLLSTIDVSEVLGVSIRRVYDLIDAGELAAERVGRTVMVRPDVLARYQAALVRGGY
jgi:excisionase family DNA binding protein